MTDAERLAGYIDAWWQATDEFTRLLEELAPEDWASPTDLAGWDVHAVAAHIAHLETILAGGPHDTTEIGDPEHVRGAMGTYTEQGVVARRDRTPDELIAEIRRSTTARHTALLADPPTDAAAAPAISFPGIPWDVGTLLRNRPLDVWMHEQDIRRAVDRPGGMDSPAAQHTADYLIEALGVVVGKRVAPPAGTSVALEVAGSAPYAVSVGEDGRARPVDPTTTATTRISLSREDFVVAAGGRRPAANPVVDGDQRLGAQVLEAFAVTP